MEDSEASANYESKKLLYKYQFAFLLMQRSFTSLSKIITTRETQVKYSFLTRWQKILPKNAFHVESLMRRLNAVLGKLTKIQHKHEVFVLRRGFAAFRVNSVQAAVLASLEAETHLKEKKLKKKLNMMLLECSALTSKNIELETALKDCRHREQKYTQKIANLTEKKGRKSPSAEELKEYNRLRRENEMIKGQEIDMELKVSTFLSQMTEVVKQAENNKQNEGNHKFLKNSRKKH